MKAFPKRESPDGFFKTRDFSSFGFLVTLDTAVHR